MPIHASVLQPHLVMRISITEWVKGGIAAVTFILVFKWLSKKSGVPALTSVAGSV